MSLDPEVTPKYYSHSLAENLARFYRSVSFFEMPQIARLKVYYTAAGFRIRVCMGRAKWLNRLS